MKTDKELDKILLDYFLTLFDRRSPEIPGNIFDFDGVFFFVDNIENPKLTIEQDVILDLKKSGYIIELEDEKSKEISRYTLTDKTKKLVKIINL